MTIETSPVRNAAGTATDGGKLPVSILIPTKNEERNLPTTLRSLLWADEVIVFDSFSDDGTVEIAGSFGAKVFQRRFDNFADHKNWALDHLQFRNEWVLILDADEKVGEALVAEIAAAVNGTTDCVAFYIPRRILVDGVWLRHAGKYPDYNIRLFRHGKARYERRLVHEHMVTTGKYGFFKTPIVHIDQKGTQRYIDRHNRYAEMEAVEAYISILTYNRLNHRFTDVFSRSFNRRRYIKNFSYKYLRFRPVLVFLYLYVFKLGFVMGRAGVKTCALRMFYEYMVDLYLEELKDRTSPVYLKYKSYIESRAGGETVP